MKKRAQYLYSRARLYWRWRWNRLKKIFRHLRLDLELSKTAKIQRVRLLDARLQHEDDYENSSNPLVSIIIPTYHRSKILVERTLPSVFQQTHQNFELIIVGDCCTDDTEERIRNINDPRVRFYNLPTRYKYPKDRRKMRLIQGFGAGNLGLQKARGLWLAHMDDDDVLSPSHLEDLLKFALNGNYELVFARHKVENHPGKWVEEPPRGIFPNGRYPFGGNTVPNRAVLYRRYLAIFEYKPDAWRYAIGGDQLMWLSMGRTGVTAGYLPKVVALKHLPVPYSSIE